MKEKIKSFVKKFSEILFKYECLLASRWASKAHEHLKWAQWRILPQPEFFDHHIDLYYQWLEKKDPLWTERGVFSGLALKGNNVLELACGDGFNARNFYSLKSKQIIACDFDPKAIRTAKNKNPASNVEYILADIRSEMPQGKFDNIIWDAAIEHFTPKEINNILKEIKTRLNKEGILSGYTIVKKDDGQKSLSHHEYEFENKEDLLNFLAPFFKNVTVFETIFPSRHNLYFWASDESDLPFAKNWKHSISHND
ncbi:MAG: class I SAM-dependent methyltransferase [Patescibacteria group bacterium]